MLSNLEDLIEKKKNSKEFLSSYHLDLLPNETLLQVDHVRTIIDN